jgi:hypothetical protein
MASTTTSTPTTTSTATTTMMSCTILANPDGLISFFITLNWTCKRFYHLIGPWRGGAPCPRPAGMSAGAGRVASRDRVGGADRGQHRINEVLTTLGTSERRPNLPARAVARRRP